MNETDIEKYLQAFREWAEKQKPALNSLTTDEFLLRFLRVTNFNLKKAKEWLILFWKYRMENPQWFTDRDLIENPKMRQIAETAYCLQLPQKTADGRLIFVMRVGHYNSSCLTLNDVTKYAFAVTDIINSQPATQTEGFIIILDLSEVNQQHVPQFTADFSRRYIDCWEKMYPVHLHQIHFYNYPSLFDPVYGMFRQLYFRDLGKRIIFHNADMKNESVKNSLHQYIDPALLPNDYDGLLGPLEGEINQSFIQWTRENNASMVELEKYGVDLKQVSQLLEAARQE